MEPGPPEPSGPGGFRLCGDEERGLHLVTCQWAGQVRTCDLGIKSPSGAVSLSAAERACNSVSGE